MMRSVLLAFALMAAAGLPAGTQELRGHGGPVRALAISRDGETALSGSFDSSAIVWSLTGGTAQQVLRGHETAVNATAVLPDGRLVTGGEDGRVLIWRVGRPEPDAVLEGHKGPVAALAVSPDGRLLGSASWDGTARLWPLPGGAPRVLGEGEGQVNAIAFLPDGAVVTGAADGALRFWPAAEGAAPKTVSLGLPVSALQPLRDGGVVAGGADGKLRIVSPAAEILGEAELGPLPVIALAVSPDGARIAAAGLRGSVTLLSTRGLARERVLQGPGLPVWSVVFTPDGRTLLTGGADRLVRRWSVETGEHLGPVITAAAADPLAVYGDDPGARVFRACAACHTLTPDGGNRAGPTLHKVIGRRIGTAPGYSYSADFARHDIVWTRETIGRLFELGPAAVTPGTKMPEQTIGSAEDREALVAFIERVGGRAP